MNKINCLTVGAVRQAPTYLGDSQSWLTSSGPWGFVVDENGTGASEPQSHTTPKTRIMLVLIFKIL
jgi:hypothetical protein